MSSNTFRAPSGVRAEARRALKWIEDGFAGDGFTATGRKRASDLANGRPLSGDTVLRMYSFLKRHEGDKQAEGFNAGEKGFPTPGRVAWSAWGGDPGLTWSSKIRDQLVERGAESNTGDEMQERADVMAGDDPQDQPAGLYGVDADYLADCVMAVDAALDAAQSLLAGYEGKDAVVSQAYFLLKAADAALDDVIEAFGEEDPDDELNEPAEPAEPVAEDASGERAAAARLGVGTWVSWQAADGTRVRGKIEKVVTKGTASSSDGYELSAVDGDPVFVVRLYEMTGNGWVPSDKTFVQRADLFTVTGALASPRCSDDVDALEVRRIPKDVEKRTYTAELRTEGDSNTVRGYAATWNTEASGLSFREAIAPGAFSRSLAEGDDVFLLVNHDDQMIPLARRSSGTLRIWEDEVGLPIEADLDPENPIAAGLLSALRRGDVDKMSFAFRVAPGGETTVDGVRMLTDVDLFEVSVVTWPAYDATTVGVRSASSDTRRRRLSMLLAR